MGGGSVYSTIQRAASQSIIVKNDEAVPIAVEKEVFDEWTKYSSTPRVDVETALFAELRKHYPNHTLKATQYMNLLSYPNIIAIPFPDVPLNKSTSFSPLPRRSGPPGILVDSTDFGAYKVAWKEVEFIIYVVSWPEGFGSRAVQVVLFEGKETVIDAFILEVGGYGKELHEEIMVYNQGYWRKDHQLWLDVQSAYWEDVILKEDFKASFRRDIEGFFDSEKTYKRYAIPWKRGVIMHGPPGNGKTISLKAVMKYSKHPCLYVRTFQSWQGPEGGMTDVFNQARLMAPCILVLEDIDTLIDESNRSFFLNQLDGLSGNDGLLLLATTNHLDKLDDSIAKRPSRFDRKFLFDDPDLEERKLYVKYWQNKLKTNTAISFPDSLVDKIAKSTNKFSFAYLKEAFVSALVLLADQSNDREFEVVVMEQIGILKRGLGDSDYSLI